MAFGRDPDPFLDSFTALVGARALTSATLLGVFDALHEGALDAGSLAERCGLDPLGAETLAEALVALGYLERDGGAYANAEVSDRLLVSSSPESIASFVGAQADLHWEVLAGLPGAVRDGEVYAMHERRQEDSPRWEAYMRGLYEIARRDNERDAQLVPLAAPRRLVDVAGGHGGFSIAMCRRFPELQSTIVDLPPSAAVGRRIVAEQDLAGRIEFREGDVYEIGLGEEGEADVVASFNLVHHLSAERNLELCRMAREALAPGGCLVIGDAAAPEEGEPPSAHGAISSLLFYAWSHGRNFRPSEIRGWLEEAGFENVSVHRNLLSLWRVVVVGASPRC